MSCAVWLYDAERGHVGCLGVGDVERGAQAGVCISFGVVCYNMDAPGSVFVLSAWNKGVVVLYSSVSAVVCIGFVTGSVRIGYVENDFCNI